MIPCDTVSRKCDLWEKLEFCPNQGCKYIPHQSMRKLTPPLKKKLRKAQPTLGFSALDKLTI